MFLKPLPLWSQILKDEREKQLWSQDDVAEKVDTDPRTVGAWERGESFPSFKYRRKLCKIYGKSPEELGLTKKKVSDTQSMPSSLRTAQLPPEPPPVSELTLHTGPREDWGKAPHVRIFYGREQERAKLKQWIVNEYCQIVAVLGMGGMGKTTFAVKLVEHVKNEFEYLFWRSLQNAPPLENILEKCIMFLSNQQEVNLPPDTDDQIALLIDYLQKQRCLLILDNFEAVLQVGNRAGYYREGYEGYGRLIQRLGEVEHLSCLLLTSQEKPKEVARLEGDAATVRSLHLLGVTQTEGRELLKDQGLSGPDEVWAKLVNLYSGNPLALKLVAEPIRELWKGDITSFLRGGETVIGDVRDLLEHQFQRLSELEKDLLYWLAIERMAVSLDDLREDIVHPIARGELLGALDSLQRRSLIESTGVALFTLQPVIMDYITGSCVKRVTEEIEGEKLGLFVSHALIKAQTKDYVRNSQMRLILAPLAEELLATHGKPGVERKLRHILTLLHKTKLQKPGYAGGNLLNLLIQLGCDLTHYDFSHLMIWQAYLQNVDLHQVNFAYAHFANSVFTDTFGSILALAFTPGGEQLAAGTAHGEVRLWDMADGIPTHTYRGHAGWVFALAFNPKGDILASGGGDGTIRLWDMGTRHCLKVLQGHQDWIRSLAFSPDGKLLASGCEDHTIRLWDVSTGDCLNVLQGHTERISSVTFSPDGDLLASGSEDHTIRLWEVSSGHCFETLHKHTNRIWSVAFSPRGNLLASGSEDCTLRLWEVSTGNCLNVLQGHTKRISSIAFTPKGDILASGSEDKTIRLWEVRTGYCAATLRGHTSGIKSVVFDAKGDILASGSEDQTVRLWDTSTGHCLKVFQGHTNRIRSVSFSPDGHRLVSGNEDGTVSIWDARTGDCLKVLPGHSNRVRAVAFPAHGSLFASASDDQTIRLWDINTKQCTGVWHEHSDWVRAVAFSPDGQLVASGSDDKTIRLWKLRTGDCISVLQGHSKRVRAVAFSPDGQLLASGSEDKSIRLWNVSTGQCLATLHGHTNRVWSVAFSPDGQFLASGSEDKTVRLWESRNGKCLRILDKHASRVWSVAFSPEGVLLASGSDDEAIHLWKVSDGSLLQTLREDLQEVRGVAFSPDGSILASANNDGTIKLWDVQTGDRLKIMRSKGRYEGMNITSVEGLTEAQKATLRALGAIEDEE